MNSKDLLREHMNIISEQTGGSGLPNTTSTMKRFLGLMKRPISYDEAFGLIQSHFYDEEMFDEIEQSESNDVRPIIAKHLFETLKSANEQGFLDEWDKDTIPMALKFISNFTNIDIGSEFQLKPKEENYYDLAETLKTECSEIWDIYMRTGKLIGYQGVNNIKYTKPHDSRRENNETALTPDINYVLKNYGFDARLNNSFYCSVNGRNNNYYVFPVNGFECTWFYDSNDFINDLETVLGSFGYNFNTSQKPRKNIEAMQKAIKMLGPIEGKIQKYLRKPKPGSIFIYGNVYFVPKRIIDKKLPGFEDF